MILAIPSAAWASSSSLTGAVSVSESALARELEQAAATGLSPAEYGRLAYELRGLRDPFARPSARNAAAFYRAQLTRAQQARADLKVTYAREVMLARGGLLRNLRGYAAVLAQASSRGVEVADFTEQLAAYRAYAGQATTINEYRDLSQYLAPGSEQLRTLVAEFNREELATREEVAGARSLLAEARAVPELQLDEFATAIDQAAADLPRARTVAELQSAQNRLRQQQEGIRQLLDMRSSAHAALEAAEGQLRRAREAGVEVGDAAATVARLRSRLGSAGTYDALAGIAWGLEQQRQGIANTIWLAQSQFTMDAPVFRQIYNLDCETAALQMGLAYFGHHYGQPYLFSLQRPDARPPVMGPDRTVLQWGNPYTNYVGDVHGDDRTPTGYGVYYPLILSIAQSHGVPNAYGGEGFSASTIYAELAARHPVEVWVETGWARSRVGTWTAWDGTPIRYSLIEHAVLLTGVRPGQVRVNDPWHGEQYWISKATFEQSWADFNNMAVILR
jgi:uncharacterized protein YvpB